ncbi:hypothetical protein [Streptomyces griseiscabiei]|uniref:Uncharacterized protein n=1 Tax=Streptomyces griseiscabiei TaxID=2993540 RepID=A0ABU4LD11_9ACTN|nr:hypothetical protein [Streptomyces griseiscabiei]MBZ3906593.1 hypothetical protein [Streptomyces griseiscabiei]MDX2913657.1 hypothetical protein [Streptomyces griseiscabiei]
MSALEKPPTTLSHGELPYPRGTLVEDTERHWTGELVGVIEERVKESGKLLSRTAYLRPRGGGIEWDAPLAHIRPVEPQS